MHSYIHTLTRTYAHTHSHAYTDAEPLISEDHCWGGAPGLLNRGMMGAPFCCDCVGLGVWVISHGSRRAVPSAAFRCRKAIDQLHLWSAAGLCEGWLHLRRRSDTHSLRKTSIYSTKKENTNCVGNHKYPLGTYIRSESSSQVNIFWWSVHEQVCRLWLKTYYLISDLVIFSLFRVYSLFLLLANLWWLTRSVRQLPGCVFSVPHVLCRVYSRVLLKQLYCWSSLSFSINLEVESWQLDF